MSCTVLPQSGGNQVAKLILLALQKILRCLINGWHLCSLFSPCLLPLCLCLHRRWFILIHYHSVVLKVWVDGHMILVQEICASAHLGVD